MLSDDWDETKQIQVMWPVHKVPGKKQEKHVARVLRFGDNQSSLLPFLRAAEDGKDVPMTGTLEYGRGKRALQPKRTWSEEDGESTEDDEEHITDRHLNKKRKEARKTVGNNAREELRKKLDEANQSDDDELTRLREENSKLKEENAALRNSFRILKALPELLGKVQSLGRNTSTVSGGNTTRLPHPSISGEGRPQSPNQRCPPSSISTQGHPSTPSSNHGRPPSSAQGRNESPNRGCPPSSPVTPAPPSTQGHPQPNTSAQNVHGAARVLPSTPVRRPLTAPMRTTPGQGHLRRVFEYDVDENGQVDLGYGVLVNANNLQYVSRTDVKKTTYTLCEVVFSRDELANSSLTGKRSNAFKELAVKTMLPENKVTAIIEFVKKMHPGKEQADVKKLIGAKLNICQKLEKRKSAPAMPAE